MEIEQFGNIKLFNGDCLEVIKVPSGRVDIDQELWNKMKQNINYYL